MNGIFFAVRECSNISKPKKIKVTSEPVATLCRFLEKMALKSHHVKACETLLLQLLYTQLCHGINVCVIPAHGIS